MTRPRKCRVYSLTELMSKASVGFRKFGIDSFQASNHRLIVRSTACCARCTAELAPTNVENSDSQKPSLKRSEEHTSELQSRLHLVCRLLLEKKKSLGIPHTSNSRRTTFDPG